MARKRRVRKVAALAAPWAAHRWQVREFRVRVGLSMEHMAAALELSPRTRTVTRRGRHGTYEKRVRVDPISVYAFFEETKLNDGIDLAWRTRREDELAQRAVAVIWEQASSQQREWFREQCLQHPLTITWG